MCARRTVEFKEEPCGIKEERNCQGVDASWGLVELHTADVGEALKEPLLIKQEEKFLYIKEEEEKALVNVLLTDVPFPSVHKESEASKPTSSSSSVTEAEGKHCGGSQTDGLIAPLSQSDDATLYSHDDVKDDDTNNDGNIDTDDKVSEGNMKCHSIKKCWKCPHCEKTFTFKCHLTKHMIAYMGLKPFVCSICGNRYTAKHTLLTHTRVHTGEKAFARPICEKTYSNNGNLKQHAKPHNIPKQFSCLVCGERFAHEGQLRNHTRIHSGKTVFICSDCGKKFSCKTSLIHHTQTHSIEKSEKHFACPFCGEGFTCRASLNSHLRTHSSVPFV
nr:gastrula zinc finger protein XlCGF8.2DB [Syngnathus scovelli]